MFYQVLELCQQVGIVRLGHMAIDGTKIKANASRHCVLRVGPRLCEHPGVSDGHRQREARDRRDWDLQLTFGGG